MAKIVVNDELMKKLNKDMTQEEKAKAYDEAIERVKGLIYFCSDSELKTLEYVFSELKDESERIRKELISFVRGVLACHDKPNAERDEKYESWIAWLEKQGEQKPAWSKEDEYFYGIIKYILNNECAGKVDKENVINWLKSLKELVIKLKEK